MLKEIGNQSITITGVLTDYYRDFKNSANNSTNAYDMVVKMNDGFGMVNGIINLQ